MASYFPNGTILSVSTALSDGGNINSMTNAKPAVATADSSGFTVSQGDIMVLNSNWADATDRVFRASVASSSTVTFEGLDTTDTDRFQIGAGDGSIQVVDDWVQLSQVREVGKTGGDQNFFQWQYLEDRSSQQKQRPTFKSAKSMTVTLDYDPAKAWYASLDELDQKGDAVVLRAVLPNGAKLFYYVYPSFDADPSLTMNENMVNTATFSQISRFTRYES
ncbi:phage tail protein [Castellaniella ginsengisoli]|uniref:Phage tail protein n=1 Tax=Castellaniella ginsengisoli TaxID=546114 RepID=A0AB39ESI3_9BURK